MNTFDQIPDKRKKMLAIACLDFISDLAGWWRCPEVAATFFGSFAITVSAARAESTLPQDWEKGRSLPMSIPFTVKKSYAGSRTVWSQKSIRVFYRP